jgi:hypothetical protein
VVDTIRTLGALQTILADNGSGQISAQDVRDLLVSVMGGFGAYEDLATKTTPLSLTGGVRGPYECDGAGPQGNTDFLPYPKEKVTDELWDSVNDRVRLVNLPVGARVSIRLNFEVTTISPNTDLDVFAIFHNSSDVQIFELNNSIGDIKTASTHGEVVIFDFFIGSVIQDGYVYFELLGDKNITVEIGGVYINIWR